MQFDTRQRKITLLAAAGLLSISLLAQATRSAIAEKAATSGDLASLRRASVLESGNAARHHWLGRIALFVEQDPASAVRELEQTTRLNPWIVDYWLDLALAYKATGNSSGEGRALQSALLAEPKNLNAAFSEGNFYLSRGETAAAMQRFRLLLENDGPDPLSVIDTAWRATHNASTVLEALPPRADLHLLLLELLVRRDEPHAAATVWQRLNALHQPLDSGHAVKYVDWLIQLKQPSQARAAWDQIQQPGRNDSRPATAEAAIVNPSFEEDLSNAGFDWRFANSAAVTLFHDDENPHTGSRSLAITYNGAPTTDAGIWQLVPVTPGSTLHLSAFARTNGLLAAIPPRLGIEDFYSHALIATGPEIVSSTGWIPTSVDFVVPLDCRLVAIRIVQGPQPTRVKGTLWLDDFSLSVSQGTSAPPAGAPRVIPQAGSH